jgi:predicted SAM-dependent methyltransferase
MDPSQFLYADEVFDHFDLRLGVEFLKTCYG